MERLCTWTDVAYRARVGTVWPPPRTARTARPDAQRIAVCISISRKYRAGDSAVSEQNEEENLRRWSREQAELERQTDVMVMRTLTSLVTQAEDLKSKLRRD